MTPDKVSYMAGVCSGLWGKADDERLLTFADSFTREPNTIRVVGKRTELFQSDDAKTLYYAVRASLRREGFWFPSSY